MSEAKAHKTKKEQTFESALERLTEVTDALEDGKVPLDQALALYEEGIGLVRFCQEKLNDAENRMKVLSRDADGDIVAVPFDVPAEKEQENPNDND